MKLYFHPVSTTSRPVTLFCAEAKIAYEPIVVDLMTGAHHQPPYTTLNPSSQVPTLDDEGFVIAEASAILKYLAEKVGSPAYPGDLRARARINERMDWVNTGFIRDLCYNLIYPQIFPHHKREPEAAQAATLEWGKTRAERWLGILDQSYISQAGFLAGDSLTIADYYGAGVLATGEIIGMKLDRWPNVKRWFEGVKALPSWAKNNEVTSGFAASLAGKPFVTIA